VGILLLFQCRQLGLNNDPEKYIRGYQGESAFLPMHIYLYDPWIIGQCIMSARNMIPGIDLFTSWTTINHSDSIWAFEATISENGQTRILCLARDYQDVFKFQLCSWGATGTWINNLISEHYLDFSYLESGVSICIAYVAGGVRITWLKYKKVSRKLGSTIEVTHIIEM